MIQESTMPKKSVFETHALEYDQWFVDNEKIYLAEINTLKMLLPPDKIGLEIGVGTGRFAGPLNIGIGVEPCKPMAERARQRGIKVFEGVAELLPFAEGTFDYALMVTTICFVTDPLRALQEARRILKPGGFLVLAFVDKESDLGKKYLERKSKSLFYQDAVFFSTQEIIALLKTAGFTIALIKQTLLMKEGVLDTLLIEDGYGKGSFIAIQAQKKSPD